MNLVSGLPPNGPTGWSPRNVDWDGDRTQDEVFNYFSGYHSLFRLVPNPSGPHPYAWEGIAHFQDTIWNGFSESQVTDLYGDSREEIVILGRLGIEIVYNTAANPLAGKYQSPWLSPRYARRFFGPVSRPVDYQSMARLVQLEVRPTTEGAVPGGDPIPYQAIGHYSDGSTADLTSVATWISGDASVAAFSGNVLTPLKDGYASIQANVAGVTNDDAAVDVATG